MEKRSFFISSIIVILALTTCVSAQETGGQDQIKAKVLAAAQSALKKRAIHSGTLDIYDKDIDDVRNLRAIKTHEAVIEQEGKYLILIDYRDIKTGDIVKVEVEVVQDVEGFSVTNVRIKEVQALVQEEAQDIKEYIDEEIQAFMLDYVKKQTQFTDGITMLFDKDNEKMRNLTLDELKKEVRRMGIFYCSRANFVDVDSGEILGIDIAVENKKGKLKVQALRIREVHKRPSQ